MKTAPSAITPLHHSPLEAVLPWGRRRLVPRRALPTMSLVRLGRGPFEKLVSMFGVGR
jgi:hypothetical protein